MSTGQWEPIVDRQTHERVVATLTDPQRRRNNRGTAPRYLLTSIARCGVCRGPVVGTNEFTYTLKNGRERVYPHSYVCRNVGCMKVTRRMADVDRHVTEVVLGVLERDGVKLLGGDPVVEAEARSRIEELEASLDLAVDKFTDGLWTAHQVDRINARLLPQLEAERERLRRAGPSPELEQYAGPGVREAWHAADIGTKKTLIRVLRMQITINPIGPGRGRRYDPDSVSIKWPN